MSILLTRQTSSEVVLPHMKISCVLRVPVSEVGTNSRLNSGYGNSKKFTLSKLIKGSRNKESVWALFLYADGVDKCIAYKIWDDKKQAIEDLGCQFSKGSTGKGSNRLLMYDVDQVWEYINVNYHDVIQKLLKMPGIWTKVKDQKTLDKIKDDMSKETMYSMPYVLFEQARDSNAVDFMEVLKSLDSKDINKIFWNYHETVESVSDAIKNRVNEAGRNYIVIHLKRHGLDVKEVQDIFDNTKHNYIYDVAVEDVDEDTIDIKIYQSVISLFG
jgi:hypothetical protein